MPESHELVGQLVSHLGATLVAFLSGAQDRRLPNDWAHADGPVPGYGEFDRLMIAHHAWTHISNAESDTIARAWFIGRNPRLGDESPVLRLREGDLAAVAASALAFVDGTNA